MTKVTTDEQHYYDIADAIRGKLGVETLYLPSEMAAAIETIETGTELTSEDEGKVVVEDDGSYVLAAQTSLSVTQNDTYDTTTNDEVVVSVSSGGGSKNILSGDEAPTASVGTNGDIYLLLSGDLVPIGATSNLIAGQNLNSGSHPAKDAFDGNDSTYWSTNDRNYDGMYIGYDTGDGNQATCIAVSICPRQWNNNVQIGDFKVQGSNDLTTWVDVASLTMPNDAATYAGVWTRFDFLNSTPYRAWRVLALTLNGSVTFTIFGLQFHVSASAINEVYLKVNGSWVPIKGQDIDDVNTGD